MGANAGGANVGGVQAIEQGTLTGTVTATTFSAVGGESITITNTVPAGKKWILKFMSASLGNFVGTLSFSSCNILMGGNSYRFVTGTTGDISFTFPQPITLSAGQTITWSFTTSAWTSGQKNCNTLYQELTA